MRMRKTLGHVRAGAGPAPTWKACSSAALIGALVLSASGGILDTCDGGVQP